MSFIKLNGKTTTEIVSLSALYNNYLMVRNTDNREVFVGRSPTGFPGGKKFMSLCVSFIKIYNDE